MGRAISLVPGMSSRGTSPTGKKRMFKNPLDLNGDGKVDSSDFIPKFLDRDGDGKINVKDMVHDVRAASLRRAGLGAGQALPARQREERRDRRRSLEAHAAVEGAREHAVALQRLAHGDGAAGDGQQRGEVHGARGCASSVAVVS